MQRIKSQKPDIVLLDVAMPGMSGIELLGQFDGLNKPLFVMITAHDESMLSQRSRGMRRITFSSRFQTNGLGKPSIGADQGFM